MAGEYEHKKGKGNRFSSTNQPQNRGRKPKLYTIAKKAYGLSYEEYKEMRMYLMQLSKKELEELAKDESTPMWVVILCRAYIKGAAKGDARSLEETKADLWIKDIAATKIERQGHRTADSFLAYTFVGKRYSGNKGYSEWQQRR